MPPAPSSLCCSNGILTFLNPTEANRHALDTFCLGGDELRRLRRGGVPAHQLEGDPLRIQAEEAVFDHDSAEDRVVAGSQHTFKLELTQVLPQLDGPPEDRIMLTKKSTQPPPFSSKAANPIVYDVYDQDVADTLKSRDRSTLVIQPPRPLDAEYYGVSDCRQAFCKKLYYVPPPAAAGTLWEALVQHCDKAQDLLACSWAKGDHTTSKEFFVMMVQAVLWPVVFEEADVHALFRRAPAHRAQ